MQDAPNFRVVATGGLGRDVAGTIESFEPRAAGGWAASILDDDGTLHRVTDADGVTIAPEAPPPVATMPATPAAAVPPVAAGEAPVAPSEPGTPSPAAEAQAVQPEPATDIAAQVAAIRDPSSGKDSALVTPGSPAPADLSGLEAVPTAQGLFVTSDPAKAAEARQNAQTLTTDQVGQLLGYTTPKDQSDGTVVEARDAQGNIVHQEATNAEGAPRAEQTAEAMAPDGGSVTTTTASDALAARAARRAGETQSTPRPARTPEANPVSAISKDEARAHLRYLGQQARVSGWTKPLMARRAEVEKRINALRNVPPEQGDAGKGTPGHDDTAAPGLGMGDDGPGRGEPSGGHQGAAAEPGAADPAHDGSGRDHTPAIPPGVRDDLSDATGPGDQSATVGDAPAEEEARAAPPDLPPHNRKPLDSRARAQAYIDRKGLAGTHEARHTRPGAFDAVPSQNPVALASAEAATSPANDRPEPTEAQKDAGNYPKGHLAVGGLDISIENPAGTHRRPEWPALKHAYGYVRGTTGADGDHVDVFLSPDAHDTSRPVFVVDQQHPDGSFDEHKAMLGFRTAAEARAAYHANYEPGWQGFGGMRKMSFDQFKAWSQGSETHRPLTMKGKARTTRESARPIRERAPAAAPQETTAPRQFADEAADGAIPYRSLSDGGRPRSAPAADRPAAGPRRPSRTPVRIEPAIIGHELGAASRHPDYAAAKAGDEEAGVRLAQQLVTPALVEQVRAMLGGRRAIVVPVSSEETTGRNAIPRTAAAVLADRLGLETDDDIIQVNAPKRTAMNGLDRVFATPVFDGPVRSGRDYLLLDDTLTQGATFAALASHIEAEGGHVAGAVALTGNQYRATLAPSPETLRVLRERYGDLEPDFRAATGYGFDALTQSEARYLAKFRPAVAVRDRISAAARQEINGAHQGNSAPVEGSAERLSGPARSNPASARLLAVAEGLRKLERGANEVRLPNLRPDLVRYGGSPDVHLTIGDLEKEIAHIAAKRSDDVLARVFETVAIGDDVTAQPAKKTVRIRHGGITAVLSLDEHGARKTWLLTGWEDGRPDAKGEVGTRSPATQTAPTFSRSRLGASLRHIISVARARDQDEPANPAADVANAVPGEVTSVSPELSGEVPDEAQDGGAPYQSIPDPMLDRRVPQPERVATLARLKRLREKLEAGAINHERFVREVATLTDHLDEARTRQREQRAEAERARGADWLRERLLRARRTEELPEDTADLALWLLDRNPHLAEDLGISIRAGDRSSGAGAYAPISRVVTLFHDSVSPGTAVHEILHHAERMMPPDVQQGIIWEWERAWARAFAAATDVNRAALLDMRQASLGDRQAYGRVMVAFRDGTLDYRTHYPLVNASEFWAVHATEIMSRRYAARPSWVQRARQWLSEMIQHVRSALHLPTTAPVLRGLRRVLNGTGERVSERMLAERAMGRPSPMPYRDEARPAPAAREPVATLTGDELGPWKDMKELGRKTGEWYRENLVGKKVLNRETGWEIEFNKSGASKVSGRKGDVLMRLVPALPEILENGHLIGSEPDNRPQQRFDAVHKFAATVMLGGYPRDIVATVREDRNGRYHYDLSRDTDDGTRFSGPEQANDTASYSPETGAAGSALEGNAAIGVANIDPDNGRRNAIPSDDGDGTRFLPAEAGGLPTVRIPDEGQVRSPALEGSAVEGDIDPEGGNLNSISGERGPDLNLDFAPGSAQASPTRRAIEDGVLGPAAAKLLASGTIRIEREAPPSAPVGADAWTDPDGTIHLLDTLPPEVAHAKLLHEMFHAGVQPLVGNLAWNRLQVALADLYRRARQGDGALSRFYREAADRVAAAGGQGDANVADPEAPISVQEFGAYAIEQYDQAPRGLRRWVDDAAGAVKAWALRRWGRQIGAVTPAELAALARSAMEAGAATERAINLGNMSDRTLYSAGQRGQALTAAQQALDTMQSVGDGTMPFGTLPRDIGRLAARFAHPRHIAAVYRPFAAVFQAVMDRMKRRDQIIHRLNQDYQPYAALSQEGKANVNRALELGRLLGTTWSEAQLTNGIINPGKRTTVHIREDGQRVRSQKDLNAALSQPGEIVQLSQTEAEAYQRMRQMFDSALDMLGNQMMHDLGLSAFVGNQQAFRQQILAMRRQKIPLPARMAQAAQMIEDFEQAKRAGYVPFSRFGDYVIVVKKDRAPIQFISHPRDADRYLARNVPDEMESFMDEIGAAWDDMEGGWILTPRQRELVRDENSETVYAERVETGLRDKPREELVRWQQRRAMDIPSVKAAYDRVRAQWAAPGSGNRIIDPFPIRKKMPDRQVRLSDIDTLANIAQIDPKEWDAIRQKFADAIQSLSFRKHFFNSDNVPGYSGDFERSITDYMAGTAGFIARRQFQEIVDTALMGIESEKLSKYAHAYLDYTDQPTEELATLRQLGFLTYIAGNVSSGLVNFTQPLLMTFPALSQLASPVRVGAEMAKAYAAALRMMTLNRDIGLNMFDPARAPADVRDDLKTAWIDGEFIPTATFEIMATAHQRNIGARRFRRGFEKAAQVLGLTFSIPERINRLATYIATHRLAADPKVRDQVHKVYRGNGLAEASILRNNYKPSNLADFIVDETQFKMGKANRPVIMRGPGTALLQFKGYTMQSVEAWGRMVLMQGKEGRIAAATSLAIMVAMSGFWGFPGADDARKLLEALLSFLYERDIDVRTALRGDVYGLTGFDWLAAAADRGAPFATGLDLGRVGMGNIAPDSDSITSLLGIPYDMLINRPVAAATQLRNGNPVGAFMAVAPKFLGNLGQAAQMVSDGFRDSRGRTVLTGNDIRAVDVLQKALGFTPTAISNVRDFHYADTRMQHATDDARARFVQRAATLLAAMDRTPASDEKTRASLERQYQQVFKDVQSFNTHVDPAQRITVGAPAIRSALRREMGGLPGGFGRERPQAREAGASMGALYGIRGVGH